MGGKEEFNRRRKWLRRLIFSSPMLTEMYSEFLEALSEGDFGKAKRRADDMFYEFLRKA
ncbi:hypothetical protein JW721_04040 [Candidatus Micrarchaeota archaeon]|nr:hypothetical protein [Candidatus Micrarchaeota archaeon]